MERTVRPETAGTDQVAAKGSLLPLHIRRHSAALDHGADIWGKGPLTTIFLPLTSRGPRC